VNSTACDMTIVISYCSGWQKMCGYNAVSDILLTFSCNKSVCKTFWAHPSCPDVWHVSVNLKKCVAWQWLYLGFILVLR